MRISDWSSDVCSSDLQGRLVRDPVEGVGQQHVVERVGEMLGHCARIRADPSAYRRILPGRFGCGAPDHLRIEGEPHDMAADQHGPRCGELAVVAAETEHGNYGADRKGGGEGKRESCSGYYSGWHTMRK